MVIEQSSGSLRKFFFQLVGKSFAQLGMGDREITLYISNVLADFAHSSNWTKLRNAEGRRLSSTVEMILANQPSELGEAARVNSERTLRKYIGDYTLFMSGLFRRFVEHGGYLDYYLEEGARSYRTVSSLDVSLYRPGFLIFEELGKSFEAYSGALDFMRKCYFAPASNDDPFAGFLRQIEGWVRHGLSEN